MPFDRVSFSRVFFRRCTTDGHIFWSAGQDMINAHVRELTATRMLPETTDAGDPWQARYVLQQGFYQRLLSYERTCKRLRRRLRFIVNLSQNVTFMSSFSEVVPTILTRTTLLWSMVHDRFLLSLEYMQIMGLFVLQPNVLHREISHVLRR